MKTACLLFLLLFLPLQAALMHDSTDVVYAQIDTMRLKLDIFYPSTGSAPFPLILWIHGGGWQSGSKADCRPAKLIRDSGFAIVSIDYRLSQDSIWPAQLHDCKAALRFVKANASFFRIDTARIGVWGSSAGGHLANMVGLTGGEDSLEGNVGGNLHVSSRVRAVCDYYGPSDFPNMSVGHLTASAPEGLLLGCAITDCPEKARAISPIYHVDAGDPPFCIFHGTADGTVIYSQSVTLDSLLRRVSVPSTFYTIPGAGHGGPEFTADSTIRRVTAFFKSVLTGSSGGGVRLSAPLTFVIRDRIQCFPNPFNSHISIQVLQKLSGNSGDVSVAILDITGRKVESLFQGRELVPSRLTWNAMAYPAGIYLLSMRCGGETWVKSLTYLK